MRRERIGGKGGSHVIGELSGSDPRSRGWDLVLRVRGWPRGSAAGPRVGRAECALVTECGNVTPDDERVLKNLCRLNTLADSYQGHYQGRLLVDHGKQLLRDCRALKGIDISKRKTRWPDIVKDIAQKGDLFKFVIDPVYDD